MDKSILEILSRFLLNQQNGVGNGNAFSQNNSFSNPAYKNYPQEAFIQSAQSQTEMLKQADQSAGGFNNISGILNLLNKGEENSMLPILLSLLGKNGNGLSSAIETLTKNPRKEKSPEENESFIIDDDVLL